MAPGLHSTSFSTIQWLYKNRPSVYMRTWRGSGILWKPERYAGTFLLSGLIWWFWYQSNWYLMNMQMYLSHADSSETILLQDVSKRKLINQYMHIDSRNDGVWCKRVVDWTMCNINGIIILLWRYPDIGIHVSVLEFIASDMHSSCEVNTEMIGRQGPVSVHGFVCAKRCWLNFSSVKNISKTLIKITPWKFLTRLAYISQKYEPCETENEAYQLTSKTTRTKTPHIICRTLERHSYVGNVIVLLKSNCIALYLNFGTLINSLRPYKDTTKLYCSQKNWFHYLLCLYCHLI